MKSKIKPSAIKLSTIKQGWLTAARRVVSPNCDPRPDDVEINLLVIHCISLPPDEFGGAWIDALFTNTLNPDKHPYFNEIKGLKVSSHLLIRRTGEIVQYVPFHNKAWHAGKSCYNGIANCNDYSIGIELEGSENLRYEEIQYKMLANTTLALLHTYPTLSPARIVGHCDIAPERKKDPGPFFDWDKYRSAI
ncbi:MAG: 1,6-anhydro-N-acetylmuramyl-L-alanine amidase AmpD [Gammaproteobacteria bacterium]|nr:1,6-anhydro-N-acetylmuramyl-L-alanine amidase AmpD [Gammaproteobacteria bacterium]